MKTTLFFRRLFLVAGLLLALLLSSRAQTVQPISPAIDSCDDVNTTGFQGSISSESQCTQACDTISGEQPVWNDIDAAFVNGTAFEAVQCSCLRIGFNPNLCASILVDGTGDPPPVDCVLASVLSASECEFGCGLVYERAMFIEYSVTRFANGDVFRQCQCNLTEPDEEIIFCEGTTTRAPTVSPAPSQSAAPSRGLVFQFPTNSPTSDTLGPPATMPPSTASPGTTPQPSTGGTTPQPSTVGTPEPSVSVVPTGTPSSSSAPTTSSAPTATPTTPGPTTSAPTAPPPVDPQPPSSPMPTDPPATDPPTSESPSMVPSTEPSTSDGYRLSNRVHVVTFAAGIVAALFF